MQANLSIVNVGATCLRRMPLSSSSSVVPRALSLCAHHQRQPFQSAKINLTQLRHLREHQEKTVRSMYWRGRSFDRVKTIENAKRSDWPEWNYRSEIFAFSRRLHENLSEETLRQIFVHPSYAQLVQADQARLNLPHSTLKTNEELRIAGEQLLDRHIKSYLRYHFNRVPEDGIEQIAEYLTSDEVLAHIAEWIGCKEIVLSEEYPPTQGVMANTVRALVGGIQSEEPSKTRRFIIDIIISYLDKKDILDDIWNIPNPKETLNLILANSQLPAYEPRILFQTGAGTLESCHVIGLYSNKKLLGSSAGETIPIAEHCAALESLRNLFDLTDDRPPFVYGDASDKINFDDYMKKSAYVKTWRFQLDSVL